MGVTEKKHVQEPVPTDPPKSPALVRSSTSAPSLWRDGPTTPEGISPGARPRVVLISAAWCQWCRVLEHEVLPDQRVITEIERGFESLHVDLDAAPLWADIPGFKGLPTLAFFDAGGRHVLTRSGFRSAPELVDLFRALSSRLERDELEPYEPPRRVRLPSAGISAEDAKRLLDRLELAVFLKVNSNDGGFNSPARHPYPALLVELERWRQHGAPARVDGWIQKTLDGARRGGSPRLKGTPLADMDFSADELVGLSRAGADAARWREGIERLPDADPYLGLQDSVDRGFFRYCAGPGWYHPHFERRAIENLAWSELLRLRGEPDEARAVLNFVETTFEQGAALATSQRSDPFYYRLSAEERKALPGPVVDPLWRLDVQSMAALVDGSRCRALAPVPTDKWPRALWDRAGAELSSAAEAPVDAVGLLLSALASCSELSERGRELSELVVERWSGEGFVESPRLFLLSRGICENSRQHCARALAALTDIPIDLDYPPPFALLSRETAAE